MEDLGQVFEALKDEARKKGLVSFPTIPQLADYPRVGWDGDWLTFLTIAVDAQATVLYLLEHSYDPDDEVRSHMADSRILPRMEDEERAITLDREFDEGSAEWLYKHLREIVQPWENHRGQISTIESAWLKDGIAHLLLLETDWHLACSQAIQMAIEDAEQTESQSRNSRSREEAMRLFKYADEMARHSRFAEAGSETKRQFMAGRLFLEAADDPRKAQRIAELAMLVHWWDIEPEERTALTERARALRQAGEPIKNIAAMLKMSEAKVRAAISDA